MATTNDQYWQSRLAAERKWQEQNLADDDAFNKQMQAYFDKATRQINLEINSELSSYAAYSKQSMPAARGDVLSEDVAAYQARAKEIVKDAGELYNKLKRPLTKADFTKEVNDRLRLYNATMRINRLELLKSRLGLEAMDAHLHVTADLADKLGGDYLDEITRQAGILGESVMPTGQADLLKIVMKRTGDYTFSQRIWTNQDILKAKLDDLITQATIMGQNPRKIALQLRGQVADAVNDQRYVTERIARTESARVQFEAQMNSFDKYGYDYVKWIAEPSACTHCQDIAHEGKDNDGVYKTSDVPSIPAH
ncbi:MAG: phage head morphogenesis protein [Schleiferilactobacillus perolens]|uniref:phage head morphogenesis protein n=1 Tax=Schleiferilactobacillus perolens TaxID=100468 RepID=UPI0039EAF0B4